MWVDVPQLWTSEPSRSRLLFRMRHRGGRAGARRNAKNGHRDLRGRHRLDGARRKAGSRVAAPSHATIFRRDARRHRAPRRRLSGLPSVYITVKASVFQSPLPTRPTNLRIAVSRSGRSWSTVAVTIAWELS